MNKLKVIAKILAKLLLKLVPAQAGNTFVENIYENVDIALETAETILKEFDVEMDFNTRGVHGALREELAQELMHDVD